MMTEMTVRLALPLLAAGQAQKEMTHNEALAAIDLLLQPVVETVGADVPPAAPVPGQCWIIGPTPTGAWAGRAGAVAGWTEAGWRFAPPVEGMSVWSRADGASARRVGAGWQTGVVAATRLAIGGVQVVGPRGAAIGDPTGGSTVDGEARSAVAAILATLRTHGLIAP